MVISNERLVRVMLDVNRLTLSIHLHRYPVEIVKSKQINFDKHWSQAKKRLLSIESEKKIEVNNAPNKSRRNNYQKKCQSVNFF